MLLKRAKQADMAEKGLGESVMRNIIAHSKLRGVKRLFAAVLERTRFISI